MDVFKHTLENSMYRYLVSFVAYYNVRIEHIKHATCLGTSSSESHVIIKKLDTSFQSFENNTFLTVSTHRQIPYNCYQRQASGSKQAQASKQAPQNITATQISLFFIVLFDGTTNHGKITVNRGLRTILTSSNIGECRYFIKHCVTSI